MATTEEGKVFSVCVTVCVGSIDMNQLTCEGRDQAGALRAGSDLLLGEDMEDMRVC
jgi:hypothetical protein